MKKNLIGALFLVVLIGLLFSQQSSTPRVYSPDEYYEIVSKNNLRNEGNVFYVRGKITSFGEFMRHYYKIELDRTSILGSFDVICLFEKTNANRNILSEYDVGQTITIRGICLSALYLNDCSIIRN